MSSEQTFVGIRVDAAGRKVSNVTLPAEDLAENIARLPPGMRLLPGRQSLSSDEWYFPPPGVERVRRPDMVSSPNVEIVADGVHVFRLDLHPATGVFFRTARDDRGRIHHEPIDVSDGIFEFVTAVPGLYEFDIDPPFPFRPTTLTITAEAAHAV